MNSAVARITTLENEMPDITNLETAVETLQEEVAALGTGTALAYGTTDNLVSYQSAGTKYTVTKDGVVFGNTQLPPNGVMSLYVDGVQVQSFVNGYGNPAYVQFSFCIPVKKNSQVYYTQSGAASVNISCTK